MSVVRWRIPAASLSPDVQERMLAADNSHHVIYVNNAESVMTVQRDGEDLVIESRADAPLDNLKSHLRYMVAHFLGGKEQVEQ